MDRDKQNIKTTDWLTRGMTEAELAKAKEEAIKEAEAKLRDKQIEQMAFNLIMATSPLGVKDLTKQFDYKTVATDLYEQYGWRKADEVAREIIGEIEQNFEIGYGEVLEFRNFLAELKKKYTEDT